MLVPVWSPSCPGTGAQGGVSVSAQCCAGSAVEQVAVLQWLCLHVLSRDLLAEIYYQACASGAVLSVLSALHGFQRLHPKLWPGKPGLRLRTVNLW